MRILFYTPLNTRCRDLESQANEFSKFGHQIFLLTQTPYGILHESFKSYGYEAKAAPLQSSSTKWLAIKRSVYLIFFCWRYRINVVYAHLEPSNFSAVLSQSFIRTRVIICRHHVDEAKLYSFAKDLSYRLTYKLAKDIIVVSARAKEYMIQEEKVPAYRIHQINLAYNFDLYPVPDPSRVTSIRQQFCADVLLLSICRLTEYKRPHFAVEVVAKLHQLGVMAKLIMLGKGELREQLQKQIDESKLGSYVTLAGYVNNVEDYLAAADFMIHPSLLESSCISLKEAGLAKLPVIVAKHIGDFDEVVNHGVNGFIVDQNKFIDESVSIISHYYKDKEALAKIGQNLRTTILSLFDIKKAAPYYEANFHKRIRKLIRISQLTRQLFKLPFSIRVQVLSYYVKKTIGLRRLDHEVIWTSFYYFITDKAVKITERKNDYLVEFSENSTDLHVLIRKGKSSDIFVFFQVFISREYQPLLDFLISKQLKPHSIIDAGANVGFFSLLLACHYRQAIITTVEPELSNATQLRSNIKINTLSDRVKVIEAALWTKRTRLTIQDKHAYEWAFSVTETDTNGNCEAFPLKALMHVSQIDKIDLLKIDIEGAEGVLFEDKDFQNLLRNVAVIAMEIHDQLVDRRKIHDTLQEYFFDFFEKGELTVAWNKKRI